MQARVVSSTGALMRSDLGDHAGDALAEAGEFLQFLVDLGRALIGGRGNGLVVGVLLLKLVDDAAERLQPRDHVARDGAGLVGQLLDGVGDDGKAAARFARMRRHDAGIDGEQLGLGGDFPGWPSEKEWISRIWPETELRHAGDFGGVGGHRLDVGDRIDERCR